MSSIQLIEILLYFAGKSLYLLKTINTMKKHRTTILIVFVPLLLAFANNDTNMKIAADSNITVTPPKIGDLAPEISMLCLDRKTNCQLSELRGKMVLVNFWASMVAQCRFENPNIVRAYTKFKDKSFKKGNGFEIFSVSLDTDLEKWTNAIGRDNLSWKYHVNDLKGYKSKAAYDYGVKAIPYNFLIDGEGRVVAINLKGAALNKALESLIK